MNTTPQNTDEQLMRGRLRNEPSMTPEDTRTELLERQQTQELRYELKGHPGTSPEDTRTELLDEKASEIQEREKAHDEEAKRMSGKLDMNNQEDRDFAESKKRQEAEDLQRRKERETILAMQGDNAVNVQRKGREIERDELIMPRRIANTYTEVNGKFFAKDSNRLMFEDKGEKLATSSTDKTAIADMVTYAKAKQWESLKLAGSQEFRREAWLQAESQGIKTQGYTPKDSDLAALKTLTQERQTNAITPVQERQKGREETQTPAPRHDINKNQAVMHDEATKSITSNMQTLQKNPALENRTTEELQKLAYWRGIVMETNKLQPAPTKEEALARFDKKAEDPQFMKKIEQATEGTINDKTTERTKQRDTHELSL